MAQTEPGDLFRKEAVRKASNAEQLDQPVTVVNPLGWLALLIFLPIIIIALIWGFLGRLPTTVSGTGILLRGGELHSVVSQGAGQIAQLYVQSGDDVAEGQVVGLLRQPLLEQQMAAQQLLADQYEHQLSSTTSNQQAILRNSLESIAAKRQAAQKTLEDYAQRLATLEKIVTAQQTLLTQGLITEIVYFNSFSQLMEMQESIAQTENSLLELDAQAAVARNNAEQTIFQANTDLLNARSRLAQLQTEMRQSSKLISPYNGRVAAIEALAGQNVEINTPIIDLEVYDHEIVAVVFFPAMQGKKITAGMPARISPSTVEVEAYGYIEGTVGFVSELPSSQQSMNALLRNPDLTRALSMNGAPIRADLHLEVNPRMFSGYQWSSSEGPQIKITPGTICTARVVTMEQPPITLLVPLLKRFFGIGG